MSPAKTASAAGDGGFLRVTQVRSPIGTKPKHRATLRALGLRGIGRTRVLADVAEVRGMIARVPHLIEVGEATPEEAARQREAKEKALYARRASQVSRSAVSQGGPQA